MDIQNLPWQALHTIAANCGQADCVALGIACPPLMSLIAPRLYRAIILDLGPRPLGRYLEFEEIGDKGWIATTVVRTSAGLRRCLQVLADHPEFASRVWSLRAKSNLPLSDYTMRTLLSGAFKNLSNLVNLQWYACPELPVDVLELLPNNNHLESLDVDMAIRFNQHYPDLHFDQLKKLKIRPFLGSDCLEWLKSVVCNSQHLRELDLCRYLDEKQEVGSGYAFVGLSDIPSVQNNVRLISDFFEPSADKLELERLQLMQFLHDNDADLLFTCVDLRNAHSLGLAGLDAPGSVCLLDEMMHKTPSVKHLVLDWQAPVSTLVKYLDHLELETLEIRIYAEPLRVLTAVSRQQGLKALKIVTKCRFTEHDFEPLIRLKQLDSLVMPFSFQVKTWTMTHKLTSLTQLEMTFSGEKSSQHHTNNNTLISCGLLSMWNDEFAYPLQYAGLIGDLRKHPNLRVVNIDGHSHTLKPQA